MTREEAIAYGKRVIDLGLNDETQAFCELAIKALEQEPCSDAISRQAALDAIMGEPTDAHYPSWYARRIEDLPLVHAIPKAEPCEDAISRQVIEDIKAEIKEQDDQTHYPYGVISIRTALQIIDKHISGKEQA